MRDIALGSWDLLHGAFMWESSCAGPLCHSAGLLEFFLCYDVYSVKFLNIAKCKQFSQTLFYSERRDYKWEDLM